jgi:hypothetical protein
MTKFFLCVLAQREVEVSTNKDVEFILANAVEGQAFTAQMMAAKELNGDT